MIFRRKRTKQHLFRKHNFYSGGIFFLVLEQNTQHSTYITATVADYFYRAFEFFLLIINNLLNFSHKQQLLRCFNVVTSLLCNINVFPSKTLKVVDTCGEVQEQLAHRKQNITNAKNNHFTNPIKPSGPVLESVYQTVSLNVYSLL